MIKEMNLYITNKCNLRCSFCRRTVNPSASISPDMDLDLLYSVLSMYPKVEQICIAGFGEPFLHEKLHGIIETVNSFGIRPNLITNGTLLRDRIDDLQDLDIQYLSISLNEETAERYEKTHGVDAFDQVINGIRAAKSTNMPTLLSKVVTKKNYMNIPEFLRIAQYYDIDGVNFVNILAHEKDDENFWDLVITREDSAIIEEIATYKKLATAQKVLVWPAPISAKEKCLMTCNSPWTTVGIDGAGRITPCRRILPPGTPMLENSDNMWKLMKSAVNGEGQLANLCRKCFGNWGRA